MLALGLGLGVQSGIGDNTPILQGARFDGTNDYLLRGADLTGNADSKLGIVAARIRFNGGAGVVQINTANNTNRFSIVKSASDKFIITGKNSANTIILNLTMTGEIAVNGEYYNILIAWDMANTAYLYIDDVDVTTITTLTNDIIDYTGTDFAIAANTAGSLKTNADIHYLYMNFAETIDFSVEANRRKFFDANGNPVYLGSDGSTPTGTAPLVCFSGSYDQWHINKGDGGGFTVTGALERPLP